MITLRDTDRPFHFCRYVKDTGTQCSRCGNPTRDTNALFRVHPLGATHVYRFCPDCMPTTPTSDESPPPPPPT